MTRFLFRWPLHLTACVAAAVAAAATAAAGGEDLAAQLAGDAFKVLHKKWWSSIERTFTRGVEPIGWWNTANGVEIAANVLAAYPEDDEVNKLAKEIIEGRFHSEPKLLIKADKSYDDQGWMAHSWLRAYEELKDTRYLDRARQWYDNLRAQAWDKNATCGGGLWWAGKPDLHYKNAITSSLAIKAAVKLSQALGGSTGRPYLQDAEALWAWFEASGLISPEGVVHDGLDEKNGCALQPHEWTYNSGSLIGALTSLYEATGNATLIDVANHVAAGAVAHFTAASKVKGVLQEDGEYAACTYDCMQFKGVLMRNLDYFVQSVGTKAHVDHAFFTAQQASLVTNDLRDGAYGVHWPGPFDAPDPVAQMAALDALLAARRHGAATAVAAWWRPPGTPPSDEGVKVLI